MRDICCPLGVLKTTVTSVMPAASDGLISATFQLSSLFQPNIFFRKSLMVASLGSEALAAVVELAGFAGAAVPGCCAEQYRLASARLAVKKIRMQRFMVPFVLALSS